VNILQIDSSILGDNSVSRSLTRSIVTKLKAASPGVVVTHRDLGQSPIPHLSGSVFMAARNPEAATTPEIADDLALGGSVLREFLDADVVVIGVAFYNFTIASQLKAWIDRILVAGQTFRYGANGPEGLAGGKRVILAIARGGFYGPGTPREAYEHAETYLRTVLGFIGITDPEIVVAEGIAAGPAQREAAMVVAEERIAALGVSVGPAG
jgi:FMN-dependent NADH-azoreductase